MCQGRGEREREKVQCVVVLLQRTLQFFIRNPIPQENKSMCRCFHFHFIALRRKKTKAGEV
jgi:hypothetical protein